MASYIVELCEDAKNLTAVAFDRAYKDGPATLSKTAKVALLSEAIDLHERVTALLKQAIRDVNGRH